MLDLTTEIKELEQAREERACSIVQINLDACLERMPDMGSRIMDIIDRSKTVKAAALPLRNLVTSGLYDAADGMLAVPEFVGRNKSSQDMLVYLGTHWTRMEDQVWHDFVTDCARKACLVYELLLDHKFMDDLFANVAFSFSRHREQRSVKDQVWVNLQNGTLVVGLDGSTHLRRHDPADFFTYALPYNFDPDAQCPLWQAFLDKVLPEREAQMLLAEYVGYCFTRNLKLEKMLILYGGGANGKSVATDVISALLGEQNVSHVDLEKLTTDDNHRSLCEGKLANISQENGPGVCYSMLKTMVSGEPVMIKRLYRDPRLVYQYGKIIAAYNTLPRVEHTLGFFRRWLLIPFDVTIPRQEMDPTLKDKLIRELPGILNWAIRGLVRLNRNRQFTVSRTCEEALEKYRLNSNSALRFLSERCVPAEDGRLTLKELYAAYKEFCREDNIPERYRYGKTHFAQQVETADSLLYRLHNAKYYRLKFKSEM